MQSAIGMTIRHGSRPSMRMNETTNSGTVGIRPIRAMRARKRDEPAEEDRAAHEDRERGQMLDVARDVHVDLFFRNALGRASAMRASWMSPLNTSFASETVQKMSAPVPTIIGMILAEKFHCEASGIMTPTSPRMKTGKMFVTLNFGAWKSDSMPLMPPCDFTSCRNGRTSVSSAIANSTMTSGTQHPADAVALDRDEHVALENAAENEAQHQRRTRPFEVLHAPGEHAEEQQREEIAPRRDGPRTRRCRPARARPAGSACSAASRASRTGWRRCSTAPSRGCWRSRSTTPSNR